MAGETSWNYPILWPLRESGPSQSLRTPDMAHALMLSFFNMASWGKFLPWVWQWYVKFFFAPIWKSIVCIRFVLLARRRRIFLTFFVFSYCFPLVFERFLTFSEKYFTYGKKILHMPDLKILAYVKKIKKLYIYMFKKITGLEHADEMLTGGGWGSQINKIMLT